MKKYFKSYFIAWFLTFVIFNAVVFLTPNEFQGYTKFGGAFWVGYVFIVLSFVIQLVCSYIGLNVDNIDKLFFNIPLLKISYSSLILTVFVGSLCMIIPDLPNWIGILVCAVITIFEFISINKATFATSYAQNVEQKIVVKTFNVKEMISEMTIIKNAAANTELYKEIDSLHELLRYSDPVTNDSLFDIETEMKKLIEEIKHLLNNKEVALQKINELKILINRRNEECKKNK